MADSNKGPIGLILGIIGIGTALLVIPIRCNEIKKSRHEAEEAALRQKAEEKRLRDLQAQEPVRVPPIGTPPVKLPAPSTLGPEVPPPKPTITPGPPTIPALVSLSAFEEGSLEILEGKHKGRRLPVAATLRNNFSKTIIGPSGDVRFRHPDDGTQTFDVYFEREDGRVRTANPRCDAFECRWLPAGYPK